MHDPQFPPMIPARIAWSNFKYFAVDISGSDLFQDGKNQHTPTSQWRDEAFEDTTIGAA